MAYAVMTYVVVVDVVMAYVVLAYVVMTYVVMAIYLKSRLPSAITDMCADMHDVSTVLHGP